MSIIIKVSFRLWFVELIKTIDKIPLGLYGYSIKSGLEGLIRKFKMFSKLGKFFIKKIFFILKTINYFKNLFIHKFK